MATYGFRIHTMTPHVRRTQQFLQIEDVSAACDDTDACDAVYNQVREIEQKLQLGTPTYYIDPAHEDAREQKMKDAQDLHYFKVTSVSRIGRQIEVAVQTGREADHAGLLGRDGSVASMKAKAAVRDYRFLMVFPTKGGMAFMISETRGRSFGGELLIEWLTRLAQRAASSVNEAGARSEEPWLNWQLDPRIDEARLEGILNESSDHTIKLRRQGISDVGGRGGKDLELVQFGLRGTPIDKFLEVLTGMWSRRGAGTEQERRAAAAQAVLTLIEPDVSGVDFTDGEINFKERGKVQRITSETVDRLFIYPLGSTPPTKAAVRKAAAPVLGRIAPALGVQVHFEADDA